MRSLKLGETCSQAIPVCSLSIDNRVHVVACSLRVIRVICFCFPDAPEHFRYTNQGGEMQIPGTDDVSDLERTRNAFTILGKCLSI